MEKPAPILYSYNMTPKQIERIQKKIKNIKKALAADKKH